MPKGARGVPLVPVMEERTPRPIVEGRKRYRVRPRFPGPQLPDAPRKRAKHTRVHFHRLTFERVHWKHLGHSLPIVHQTKRHQLPSRGPVSEAEDCECHMKPRTCPLPRQEQSRRQNEEQAGD
jgi:hypothetical protein